MMVLMDVMVVTSVRKGMMAIAWVISSKGNSLPPRLGLNPMRLASRRGVVFISRVTVVASQQTTVAATAAEEVKGDLLLM